MNLHTSGAGLMFLIISLAACILVFWLYSTSHTHPDAGPAPDTWVMRQMHLHTGQVRYVATGTTDRKLALDMAQGHMEVSENWICTDLIQARHLV